MYNMQNYSPFVADVTQNSLPLMAIKVLIQTPCEWLYNPTIELSIIGYVIETLQTL